MNVLFVDTNNIGRSAVAERVLNSFEKSGHLADSCGTGKSASLGHGIPVKMREVLEENNYPSSGHISKRLDADLVIWADVIVCMNEIHRKHLAFYYPESEEKLRVWEIMEPRPADGLNEHRRAFQRIKEKILEEFVFVG